MYNSRNDVQEKASQIHPSVLRDRVFTSTSLGGVWHGKALNGNGIGRVVKIQVFNLIRNQERRIRFCTRRDDLFRPLRGSSVRKIETKRGSNYSGSSQPKHFKSSHMDEFLLLFHV